MGRRLMVPIFQRWACLLNCAKWRQSLKLHHFSYIVLVNGLAIGNVLKWWIFQATRRCLPGGGNVKVILMVSQTVRSVFPSYLGFPALGFYGGMCSSCYWDICWASGLCGFFAQDGLLLLPGRYCYYYYFDDDDDDYCYYYCYYYYYYIILIIIIIILLLLLLIIIILIVLPLRLLVLLSLFLLLLLLQTATTTDDSTLRGTFCTRLWKSLFTNQGFHWMDGFFPRKRSKKVLSKEGVPYMMIFIWSSYDLPYVMIFIWCGIVDKQPSQ